MKKTFRIITILLIPFIITGVIVLKSKYEKPSTIRAYGDLSIDFKTTLPGDSLFNITNFVPGGILQHDVDVKNDGSAARYVAVKGQKVNGDTIFEDILEIRIYKNSDLKYRNTLSNFLNQEINLDPILPGQILNYNFVVTFPAGADNNYQNKTTVFDITFGTVTADHIVINEVYPRPNNLHGIEPKNEWLELYNPTAGDVNLKNWTFTDKTGVVSKINSNTIIRAGQYILVSKDASTWRFWNVKPAGNIELGGQIGNGLDNDGEKIILKDSKGNAVDSMEWGNLIDAGKSFERIVPGFDSDQASDWHINVVPSPGL